MRTADSIEETKAQKNSQSSKSNLRARGRRGPAPGYKPHPNSLKNLRPYILGVSGNPGGKPKIDVGAVIARAVLEQNQEAAYTALAKALLKGNGYVFKELCERGFGKLKETHEVNHRYEDVKDADLNSRCAELLVELGLAAQIDDIGRTQGNPRGASKTNGKAKTSDVLS